MAGSRRGYSCADNPDAVVNAGQNFALGAMRFFRSGAVRFFHLGAVRPGGWLYEQMRADMEGFLGQLDQLVPDLFGDPIYHRGRLTAKSPPPKLGNLKAGDAPGEAQYKWWNSETQSNWWDAYIRHAVLLRDERALARCREYVARVLASQDSDGYLGIYAPELRYRFDGENGELWAKATLLRGLLAWYVHSADQAVLDAVIRCIDNVMSNWPLNASQPFAAGQGFSGGVAHGLVISDVLEQLFVLTKDERYREYAHFLYTDFSRQFSSEPDAQLPNVQNEQYRLRGHGVHTYEHLRPLLVAALHDPALEPALWRYAARLRACWTATGGAIGDEWIKERTPHADDTGYEFCSLHEMLDSWLLLLEHTGNPALADDAERLFYNAIQGARHPTRSAIAYLKTDNSTQMMGTRNGHVEPDRKQTRYKYSPVHQDVAVCCAPNAGRCTPAFLRAFFSGEGHRITALLFGPADLHIQVGGQALHIRLVTQYPFDLNLRYEFTIEKSMYLNFRVRRPAWATGVVCSEAYVEEPGFLVFARNFTPGHALSITFEAAVLMERDVQGMVSFSHGPLVYALPLAHAEHIGRVYAPGMEDCYCSPTQPPVPFVCAPEPCPELLQRDRGPEVHVTLLQHGLPGRYLLVPVAHTVLRRVAFETASQPL
ncbi:MAG: hypothetical protein GC205_09240 [Bacteroidetes bacterium]|nr:hypothetical protein [Bacteroidota bacterium]